MLARTYRVLPDRAVQSGSTVPTRSYPPTVGNVVGLEAEVEEPLVKDRHRY
jgi:hypothetical protein